MLVNETSHWAGDHLDPALKQVAFVARRLAADAMVMEMGTATSAMEWVMLWLQAFDSWSLIDDISKMFQYGCWGQYQPDIPGQ